MKVSVICTGQLRDPFEFGIIVTQLLKLKEQGRMDQLILSSWKDDLIAQPEVLMTLRQAGFQIVLSDMPATPGPGYCWMQKRQLAAGLQHVEPGSIVAKVRTDKCAHLIDRVVMHADYRRRNWADESEAGFFKRRVSVTNIVTNWVLSQSDFTFVGLREDLLRMTLCDATDSAWVGFGPVAEVEWYHGALRGADPVTDLWMRHLDAGLLARSLTKLEPEALDKEALAELWPIFARAWMLTTANYRIIGRAPLSGPPLPRDLPLLLLNGQQGMAPKNGLALVGPKVKVGNEVLAEALTADPAMQDGAACIPDFARVENALKTLLGSDTAKKVLIGQMPESHSPLEGGDGASHAVLVRSVFGAGADAVIRAIPDAKTLDALAQGRDPNDALTAEAIRIGQEGVMNGDEIKQRAAAEVLAMLTYKRHPPALPALLATPQLGRFVDAARLRGIFQRAASFEPKVRDLVKAKAEQDPAFPEVII